MQKHIGDLDARTEAARLAAADVEGAVHTQRGEAYLHAALADTPGLISYKETEVDVGEAW